jgi:1,4-alpha-glucan branching enzyme
MYFVNHCHKNDIGVLVDWVPAHFPKDAHGLNNFDGRQIYAYQDWKKGEHQDWGTMVFDFGRNEVTNFLISSALFWLDKYHIDGLRVDAVASMLYLDYSREHGQWDPNVHGGNENLEAIEFLKKFNETVHSYHPGVLTIAEESTAFGGVSRPTYIGGLGFSMKWNMGWMHDTLEYFSKEPIYRKHHQDNITFSMMYAFTENFVLPISHDEVVHGKRSLHDRMPGDEWQKLANLRLYLAFMFTHPGKKLLFMGQEFGQIAEWNHDASLDWHLLNYARHQHSQKLTQDLNRLYRSQRALHELDFAPEGFEWIDFSDADSSLLSFVRWSKEHQELILVVCNMTPVPRPDYRVGVPWAGFYKEILNTDSSAYGGSGMGNYGGVRSDSAEWQGRPHSVLLQLPPLGCVIFKYEQ